MTPNEIRCHFPGYAGKERLLQEQAKRLERIEQWDRDRINPGYAKRKRTSKETDTLIRCPEELS